MPSKITQVKKRDGSIVDFNLKKIGHAILKALEATEQGNGKLAKKLSQKVIDLLEKRFKGKIPSVEQIQDIVEEVLILEGYTKTAKAYIYIENNTEELEKPKKPLRKRLVWWTSTWESLTGRFMRIAIWLILCRV